MVKRVRIDRERDIREWLGVPEGRRVGGSEGRTPLMLHWYSAAFSRWVALCRFRDKHYRPRANGIGCQLITYRFPFRRGTYADQV